MTRPTANEVRRMLKMRECGSTYQEIGDHFGKSKQAVYEVVKRYKRVIHSDNLDNKKVEE